MPALNLLKRISSALYICVTNGIDLGKYIWEEIRNINREDWAPGELRKVIDSLEERHTTEGKVNIPEPKTTTGKINMRLLENDNDGTSATE